jgi:hypothetical protein
MEGAGRVSTAIGENGTHGLEICTSRRVYCQLGLRLGRSEICNRI